LLEQGRGANVDIAQEILGFTRNIFKAYQKASPTLKRHYLGFFWQKFEIGDGVIIKSHPTLLFQELFNLQKVYYKTEETKSAKKPLVSNEVIIKIPLLPLQDAFRTLNWAKIKQELEFFNMYDMFPNLVLQN